MKSLFRYVLAFSFGVVALSCVNEMPLEDEFIENRDPNAENVISSNPYWDWVDKYPGVVSTLIERVFDVEVTVKGGYAPLAFAPEEAVLQSTSLYAPSAENITIEVPAGVSGLQYQIGMGYELLPNTLRKRYENVVKRGNLEPGTNVVMSNFGGYIYICYPPDQVPAGDITVTVSGAVPSYDYIKGETDRADWVNTMQERAALVATPSESADSMAFLMWTEIISDKVIITAGVKEMSEMTNPDEILDHYSNIVDAFYRFAGLDPTNQPPMRVYSDIQLPDAQQTTASPTATVERYGRYPIGYLRGETDTQFNSEKKLLNPFYLQAQTDTRDNTDWLKFFLGFGDAVDSQWQKSDLINWPLLKTGYYHYAATIGKVPGGAPIDFIGLVNTLNTDFAHTTNNKDKGLMWGHLDESKRTTLFMQLANEYGWGIFPYISQRCRELGFQYIEDPHIGGQVSCDFFAMSACEYADKNLLPFFRRWHFPVSTIAMDYMKNFDDFAEGDEFWTVFDGSVTPTFESREANKNFTRPSDKLKFTTTEDTKWSWYMHGRLLDYNAYNDPEDPREVIVRENNSISNTEWLKAFDGNTASKIQILGHCEPVQHSTWAHIPTVTLYFTGPPQEPSVEPEPEEGEGSEGGQEPESGDETTGDETTGDETTGDSTEEPSEEPEEDEGIQYSQDPLTFNTFMFFNANLYYFVSYVYDIKWWDEENQEWKPTVPNEFKLHYTQQWEYYYFEETYTTTKLEFKLQPITPGTSGYALCEVNELGFGLVEEVK